MARDAERLAALKEAALSAMQRDAALSALATLQEFFGAAPDQVPSIDRLLVAQSQSTGLEAAAALKVETARLRAAVGKIRASEAASRDWYRQQLQTLARACAQLTHACLPPEAPREATRTVDSLRREVLALVEQVRRELDAARSR